MFRGLFLSIIAGMLLLLFAACVEFVVVYKRDGLQLQRLQMLQLERIADALEKGE